MEDRVIAKQRSMVQETTNTTVATELDKVVVGSVVAFTGVIGLWAAACLVSAMYQAGGPLQLAMGWFQAVSGM